MLRAALLFTIISLISSFSIGQKGATVRGFLTEVDNGAPVLYTYVVLRDTADANNTYADQTDEKGFFQISRIPKGVYDVEVTTSEFLKYTKRITLKDGDLTKLDIALEPNDKVFEEFEVYGTIDPTTRVGFVTPVTKRGHPGRSYGWWNERLNNLPDSSRSGCNYNWRSGWASIHTRRISDSE